MGGKRGRPKKNLVKVEENDVDKLQDKDDETISEMNLTFGGDNEIEEDNFLEELDNEHYEIVDEEEEKEREKKMKENEKLSKIEERERNRQFKQQEREFKLNMKMSKMKPAPKKEEDEGLFSDNPTQILGRDKHELISKLNQYKSLFPDQLKKFKVKKNASVEELKQYLDEMEAIVHTSSVEGFITDAIIHCVKITEGVSQYTRYNIKGCADALNSNPKFHELAKMLYIKYKVFSSIPVEFQMLMLVSTTAYLMKCKNDEESQKLLAKLEEPIIPENI
jgi:hypothetical protein